MEIRVTGQGYLFTEAGPMEGAFRKGLLLQLLNPKVAVYGLTIYSTFLATLEDRIQLVLSALAFAGTAFLSISTWALFGEIIKDKLESRTTQMIVNALFSLLLVYTAIDLSGIW